LGLILAAGLCKLSLELFLFLLWRQSWLLGSWSLLYSTDTSLRFSCWSCSILLLLIIDLLSLLSGLSLSLGKLLVLGKLTFSETLNLLSCLRILLEELLGLLFSFRFDIRLDIGSLFSDWL
jgi:hypothetical protein